MNLPNYFLQRKKITPEIHKKAKSSNRIHMTKQNLPSIKLVQNKENLYIKNSYLEITNQNIGSKKNNSQLHYQIPKARKPFSGNPLKFQNKKDINSIKYYPERDIFTANPYLAGYNNSNKKYYFKKGNGKIGDYHNKYLIYPFQNNAIKNIKNDNKKVVYNSQKENNLKLQNKNRIVIVAANKQMKNINLEDTKRTEKEIDNFDLCFISYSYSDNPNLEHRKDMEDFHFIKALLNKKIDCSYFGLFDGHSGKEVGIYLMENLHKFISQEMKTANSFLVDDMKNILINSFEKIDQEINNQNFKNETGSTGTVLLLYKDYSSKTGKSFICANVGDTKAYLITRNEMILITKDHKCSDLDEVKRIKDRGGVVFRERVFGTLMLTRSFGDKEMKKYGVLPTPDTYYKNIEEDDLFIVMASDGVWDVVEEDEILALTKNKISSSDFSKKIIQLAKDRDTHDNISCIVVKLNKIN